MNNLIIYNDPKAKIGFKSCNKLDVIPILSSDIIYRDKDTTYLQFTEANSMHEPNINYAIVAVKNRNKYIFYNKSYWKAIDIPSRKFINSLLESIK